MSYYGLILGVLAVWRVTHLLNAEDGPAHILARLRQTAGASALGDLLDCFNCLSLAFAAPFAALIGESWTERTLLWFALSGGAIAMERALADRVQRPVYFEEREVGDELLRQDESLDEHAGGGR